MQCNNILENLKSLSNPKAVEGMGRFGVNTARAYGISMVILRKMAREIGRDHALTQELWASDIHEAQILASLIDDPAKVTVAQMESWVRCFDSWDICDQCCQNLFAGTIFACQKAVEWSSNDSEFVKRAGFVLMARLAVSDKKASDSQFERFLPIIKREATDDRNFVKKAVNWALRQIGKRNARLRQKAIETARELQQTDSKSARWIASDALRELTRHA